MPEKVKCSRKKTNKNPGLVSEDNGISILAVHLSVNTKDAVLNHGANVLIVGQRMKV